MVGIDVFAVADGYYEVGEIRRLRGDLAGAEEAYTQAHELGRDPQPGLALLRLAQGRIDAAAASIAAALAAAAAAGSSARRCSPPRSRSRSPPATSSSPRPRRDEVAETADAFDSAGLRAEGAPLPGRGPARRGRAVEALASLRLAFNAWQELDAPYEAARTRVLLAEAYPALGDADAATPRGSGRAGLLRPARRGRDRAADGDRRRPDAPARSRCSGWSPSGKSNREIAEELFLSQKTVARHVSNIFTKIGRHLALAAPRRSPTTTG